MFDRVYFKYKIRIHRLGLWLLMRRRLTYLYIFESFCYTSLYTSFVFVYNTYVLSQLLYWLINRDLQRVVFVNYCVRIKIESPQTLNGKIWFPYNQNVRKEILRIFCMTFNELGLILEESSAVILFWIAGPVGKLCNSIFFYKKQLYKKPTLFGKIRP